eukprot:137408_1
MSQDVVKDWNNREFIETVEIALRKCVDFLNNFHDSARYRLSVVDTRLSTLERKLDFLEASLENCDPSRRDAKSSLFKGSIFDLETRLKFIQQNAQKKQQNQNQRIFTQNVVAPNKSLIPRHIINAAPSSVKKKIKQAPEQKTVPEPPKKDNKKQTLPPYPIKLLLNDKNRNQINIVVIKEGTGDIPTISSVVEIEYIGYLSNGKQFVKHREVIQLGKKQNIKGLEQALTTIKTGSIVSLWIPSKL